MDQTRIKYLLKQYAAGALTGEEQQELEQLLSSPAREELAEQLALIAGQETPSASPVAEERSLETFRRIVSADKPGKRASPWKTGWRWLSAAAVALLCLSAAAYLLLNRRQQPPAVAQTRPAMPEKQPGRHTAVLTLADNSVVELDSLGNGHIVNQGGSRVLMANGQLAYEPQAGSGTATPAFNKISTPRGGEFTITLPDGTRVWLNAASSLKFPTVFSGPKREVELTGEAYLEVAEDKAHPFEVKVRDINVAVLGTKFNIMGYEDEANIVTTLLSGSVRVTSPGNPARLLAPGQHAVIGGRDGSLQVGKADVEEELAWKNGIIYFNGANIRQIMRQVSRWYDVDVEYKGNVVNMDFTCTVSRNDKLSKLLGLLELTGAVHFSMEGNTITVQP